MKPNMHETYDSTNVKKLVSNRKFGFTVGTVFVFLSYIRPYRLKWEVSVIILLIGCLLILFATIRPSLLKYPNHYWTKLGATLHAVTNPIIMAIIYFLCFVPIGLVMRILAIDPLRRKKESQSNSYWITKDINSLKLNMNRQY